jgi:hypothetical protein
MKPRIRRPWHDYRDGGGLDRMLVALAVVLAMGCAWMTLAGGR